MSVAWHTFLVSSCLKSPVVLCPTFCETLKTVRSSGQHCTQQTWSLFTAPSSHRLNIFARKTDFQGQAHRTYRVLELRSWEAQQWALHLEFTLYDRSFNFMTTCGSVHRTEPPEWATVWCAVHALSFSCVLIGLTESSNTAFSSWVLPRDQFFRILVLSLHSHSSFKLNPVIINAYVNWTVNEMLKNA